MPKGGVSGITQTQLEAAVQAALESPENFAVIKDANEAAIIATSGGGGDSGLVFPDLVVSGTGPYVVPAGFNAIVRVSCRGSDVFTINGFRSLGDSTNRLTHVNLVNAHITSINYVVPNNFQGNFYTAYGGAGGNTGSAFISVNNSRLTLLSGNGTILAPPAAASGNPANLFRHIPVAGGDNITVLRSVGSVTSYITGTLVPIGENSSESQTYIIPSQSLNPPNVFPYPQTVINGGSERVVELYAI